MAAGVGQSRTFSLEFGALMLVLLLVGIAFWCLLLPRAETSVFGRVPILDEVYYLDRAAELAQQGGVCPADPCFMSPLYPQLIRLSGSAASVPEDRVFSPELLRGIRLLQAACWLATMLLLAWIARRDLVPAGAGRTRRLLTTAAPPVLFFLYRPAAIYATAILVEMPLAFLVTAAVAFLPGGEPGKKVGIGRPLAAGLVLGLAGLLRGSALALAPLGLWLLWRRSRESGERRWLPPVLLAGAVALVLAVPVLHNSRLTGRLSPPTLNKGVNLFIGNGPAATGFYVAAVPGDWRQDPAGRQFLAEQAGRPGLSLAQADSAWTARTKASLRADPLRVLGLWGRKCWLHLQGWEIDQLIPLDAWSRQVGVSRILIVPYGLLVMLGFGYGLLAMWRRTCSPPATWMAGLLLIIAVQSVFFVVSRYRLVLVPLWVLLATAAIGDSVLRWRPRLLLLLAGLLVAVPWGLKDVQALWNAMAEANQARRTAQIGVAEDSPADLLQASRLYRRALAGGAPGPVPWQGLVAVDGALHDTQALDEDLDRGLTAFPEDLSLLKQKVSNLLLSGGETQALPLVRRILADHPRDADTLHNAAVLLAGQGDPAEALAMATRLVTSCPKDPRGYVDLGIIQARLGRKDEARRTFARGLELHPDNAVLKKNLQLLGPHP